MHAALKFRVGLRENGQADHPDFNSLACVQASGVDWSYYVDRFGGGVWYDFCCGHDSEEPDSPKGVQWAVICAPEDFVDEAVERFPNLCEEIGAAECEVFHDQRFMFKQGAERRDQNALQSLAAEKSLLDEAQVPQGSRKAFHERVRRALDPLDPEPGVRKNKSFAEKNIQLRAS